MNPLRCNEVQNSLVDYLEFELPLLRREKFYEHLVKCSECRAVYDDLRYVFSEMKSIEVAYPQENYWADLPVNVLNEVKHQRAMIASDRSNKTASQIAARDVSNNYGDNDKVILLSDIKERKNSEPVESFANKSDDPSDQIKLKTEALMTVRHWINKGLPRTLLPIAATLLLGVALTFSWLERETVIKDNVGFQAQIQSRQSLAELAGEINPFSQPGNQFGFAAQVSVFNGFSIGSLFSEAKAYAAAGRTLELKTYLSLLISALERKSTPKSDIINHLDQLRLQLGDKVDSHEVNKRLTGLLNDYVAEVKTLDEREYYLVTAGAWLFDFALATVAQDDINIRQPEELKHLTTALQSIGAPPGVITSLDEIQAIVNQPSLTRQEYRRILQAVDNIRNLLG